MNANNINEIGFQRQQEQPGCYACYLDDAQQSRYILHGAGFRVMRPDFKVDFDFTHTDRCDRINS